MLLYFMAQQLKAIGGPDYTTSMSTTLLTNSRCKELLNSDQMMSAEIVIEKNNAVAAGASISSNINVNTAAIDCILNATESQLQGAYLQLRCELGYAHSYPQ